MKLRGLLMAVVLLAALGGLSWWSERREKAEEAKPPKDAPPKLVSIPDDQFQQIEIRKRAGAPLVLKRNASNQWEIIAPSPLAADQDAVNQLVSSLGSLSADRVVEEKAQDLSGYGLNPAAVEIGIIKKDGKTEKLLLGDDTPVGSGAFAKLAGEARVVTIASYSKTSLDKSPADLRDKRLLSFNTEKLTGVEMTAKGESFVFARNNNNEWTIVKPGPARADNFQVEELIRKLKDLQMTSGQDEAKAPAEFASGKPVLTAKLTDASGTQTLEVRSKGDKSYARSSVRPAILAVESSAVDGVNKPLADYRNKKLFDFGFSDPGKLEVRQGAKTILFTKGGEKWFFNGKEMDSTGVQATISRVRDLTATGFATSGFASADVEVAATWNDGKRSDRAQFTRTASGYVARREGEPALYTLDAGAVDEVVKTAAEVKEAQPPPKDSKKK